MVVLGNRTLVLMTGMQAGVQAPVVAAGRFGQGRIVAFGHTGYAAAPDGGETREMLANAARWAARGGEERSSPIRALALDGDWPMGLAALGITPLEKPADWLRRLGEFDLLCVTEPKLTESEIAALQNYIQRGGGLLAAGLGWGWLQLNPGKTLVEHPLNRLLADAGILWADGYLDRTSPDGYAASAAPSPLCHATEAVAFLVEYAGGRREARRAEIRQATATATCAARTIPPDDKYLRPRLKPLLAEHARELTPTENKPVTLLDALPRMLLALQIDELNALPARDVKAHAAASNFPGEVPADATHVTRTLRIEPRAPDWHSTGLYAPAGQTLTVEIPESATKARLHVRIGAHCDELWHHDAWNRVPQITLERPLDQPATTIASPFGGPVYVVVPRDCTHAALDITIRDAIEMPHYVHGTTELAVWRESIRRRPAPWAELESSKIILTVPARVVRRLNDPDVVMTFWDELSDAHAALATTAPDRMRPERFVADVQISGGYMHSGYPIMTHLDVAEHFVDVARLRSGDGWGFFHELGHNHQQGDWTFDGTGEVTCNLFALHAIDTICKPKPGFRGHAAVDKPPDVVQYVACGSKFAEWKRDPFLALQMYIQLQRQFGWPAFKKVFAEYRELPEIDRPKNDEEKRDQWLVRFSRTVECNLGPFFQKWGVPTSDAARQSIADLPIWMPDELAPK